MVNTHRIKHVKKYTATKLEFEMEWTIAGQYRWYNSHGDAKC